MKFLATGDLQIHAWRQFAYTTKSGMNSRLRNCLRVLSFLRKTALERGINKILLNGDILEECDYIEIEVYDGLYTELERIRDSGIHTVINIGNHDVHSESGGRVLNSLRALRGVATIVEEPTLVWGCVQVVPWCVSPDRLRETIGNLKADRSRCLVLHYGVQGGVTGPKNYLLRSPVKLRDIRYKEFGLVLLSDYHTRQRLAKRPPVYYLGSPIQHSFGEIHRPCVWEIGVDRGGVFKTEKIFTSFPRFRRVRANDRSSLLEATRKYAADYVSITPVGTVLSEQDIRMVAKRVGFQYIINRAPEEREDVQDSRSLNFKKAMKKYVSSNVKSEAQSGRLLRLGWKIFNGEL